jgi:hypothetical protein
MIRIRSHRLEELRVVDLDLLLTLVVVTHSAAFAVGYGVRAAISWWRRRRAWLAWELGMVDEPRLAGLARARPERSIGHAPLTA